MLRFRLRHGAGPQWKSPSVSELTVFQQLAVPTVTLAVKAELSIHLATVLPHSVHACSPVSAAGARLPFRSRWYQSSSAILAIPSSGRVGSSRRKWFLWYSASRWSPNCRKSRNAGFVSHSADSAAGSCAGTPGRKRANAASISGEFGPVVRSMNFQRSPDRGTSSEDDSDAGGISAGGADCARGLAESPPGSPIKRQYRPYNRTRPKPSSVVMTPMQNPRRNMVAAASVPESRVRLRYTARVA